MKKFLIFSLILCSLPGLTQNASAAVYPDGTVMKAVDDTKVYLIEHGVKRWMETESAYFSLGFSWDDLQTVSPHELDVYSTGLSITDGLQVDLPLASDLLPDLVPLASEDVFLDDQDGQLAIRFTALFWNEGPGRMDIMLEDYHGEYDSHNHDATQLIQQIDGTTRERDAGVVIPHDVHEHYHLEDFSEYRLEATFDTEYTADIPTYKASFCMRDDRLIDGSVQNASPTPVNTSCLDGTMGVSVGWADVYPYTLEDQYLVIEGLDAGIYSLTFEVDPFGLIEEGSSRNNISSTLVYIDPNNEVLDILGNIAAFETANNWLDDGLLISGANSTTTYLMHDNRKRAVSQETLTSYGYSTSDVIEFDDALVDAIPAEEFVKTGDGTIYMLNEHGYVRRILNPTVFGSYETGDIPVINSTELNSYQETEMIQKQGDDRVYSLYTKTLIGFESQLSMLDVPQLAVQKINETDFMSYVVAVEEENLEIPWAIAFLPDGDMLVTERPGILNRFGNIQGEITVPGVLHSGEGGLMGVVLHPEFESNQLIYLYFTTEEDGSKNRVVRFKLDGLTLIEDKIIIDDIPGAVYHDGGQMAFGPDGMLYITAGDASQSSLAQDLGSLAGSTLRITPDGDIPADNPFGTAIWSYGHRNAQGIAWDSEGNMWQTEHGRSGTYSGYDELNLVEEGQNYGWPTIQGPETASGMQSPKLQSGPYDTWAPSGMTYYDGTLYFSGLRGSRIYAVDVTDGSPVRVKEYFSDDYGRLRAAVIGPDDMLYVTTSNRDNRGTPRAGDDKIIKIAPGMLESVD